MKKLLIYIAASLLFINCSFFKKGSSSKKFGKSSTTGWNKKNKFDKKNKNQVTGPGLVFIEGGSFTMGRVKDDVMHDWNNTPTKQQVKSFYLDETEVTNEAYLEYLDWLKKVFPPKDRRFKNVYYSALPDTLVWNSPLSHNEVYVKNYLRHPAYAEYPVVGVSWLQANKYAQWRTDRVNELTLIQKGIIRDENRKKNGVYGSYHFSTEKFKEDPFLYSKNSFKKKKNVGKKAKKRSFFKNLVRRKGKSNSKSKINRSRILILPEYRLPTEVEWEYAAALPINKRNYNSLKGKDLVKNRLRVKRGRRKGDFTSNFKRGKGNYSGISGWGNDGAEITNSVKSGYPNDLGIYNMYGNVAEWVADVYRPIIDDQASDFNYYRGNEFTKLLREDGKAVTKDYVIYDTLKNGKLMYKTLPGETIHEKLSKKDLYLRDNIHSSNDRNYRDGDDYSIDGYNNESKMYNSPENKSKIAYNGTSLTELDKSNNRTSAISDHVRVIKGGSWKDSAYWLDPAERRFQDEESAFAWIGFRCAMDKVGSMSRKKKKRRSFKRRK